MEQELDIAKSIGKEDMSRPIDLSTGTDMAKTEDMVLDCTTSTGGVVAGGATDCQNNALFICDPQGKLTPLGEACGEFPVDIRIQARVLVTNTLTSAYGVHPHVKVTNVGTSEVANGVLCKVNIYEEGKFIQTNTEDFRGGCVPRMAGRG